MKRTSILAFISLPVLFTVAGTLLAESHESLFGTWKMNPAKSNFSPGPLPKSNLVKWEAFPGGAKITADVVPVSGEPQHYESSGKFDGKDNPVKGNNPDADTMAFSKIDDHNYEVVMKRGGKTTIKSRMVVAADGKTRVTTQTGTNGKGEAVKNTMFYERE
jgi:hypothetical protein